jgi:formylglycine-generating enzyme required for sulfatase activity
MGAQKDNSNGDNYDDEANDDGRESPVHRVTLSNYYIGETEVTQALWFTVMSKGYTENQTGLPNGNSLSSSNGLGANYPVYNVSWDDIVGTSSGSKDSFNVGGIFYYDNGFCYRLSELVNGGPLTAGCRLFSLPTEAEWEYAARGGKKSRGHKYSGSDDASDVAWFSVSDGSHVVGQKDSNELCLYDMSGNVYEWCADAWTDNYSANDVSDPIIVGEQTASGSLSSRVYRGGGWHDSEWHCRVSCRDGISPSTISIDLGFRVRCGS